MNHWRLVTVYELFSTSVRVPRVLACSLPQLRRRRVAVFVVLVALVSERDVGIESLRFVFVYVAAVSSGDRHALRISLASMCSQRLCLTSSTVTAPNEIGGQL